MTSRRPARERVAFGFGEWLGMFFEELGRHNFDAAAARRAAIARLDAAVAAQDALDRIVGHRAAGTTPPSQPRDQEGTAL